MDVDIPARLNAALARTNISQQTLARRLGVGKSTVSHWVNGHREISIEIAGRIAEALRVEEGGVELHVNAAWLAFAMGEMLIITRPSRKLVAGSKFLAWGGDGSAAPFGTRSSRSFGRVRPPFAARD